MSECVTCWVYGRPGEPREPAHTEHGWIACPSCQGRIRTHLADIPTQYRLLDATPGSSNDSARVSGSREQSLGVRTGVLDLIVPTGIKPIVDPNSDQMGNLPVAAVLASWVDLWIHDRKKSEHYPGATVDRLVGWLTVRLDWAFQYANALDDFTAELRQIVGLLYITNGDATVKPDHKEAVPCSRCDLKVLYDVPGDRYIECLRSHGGCGQLLTVGEYYRWVGLLHAILTPQQKECGKAGHDDLLDVSTPSLPIWKCKACGTEFRKRIPTQRKPPTAETNPLVDINSRGGRA
jgi:hypothetical protein